MLYKGELDTLLNDGLDLLLDGTAGCATTVMSYPIINTHQCIEVGTQHAASAMPHGKTMYCTMQDWTVHWTGSSTLHPYPQQRIPYIQIDKKIIKRTLETQR